MCLLLRGKCNRIVLKLLSRAYWQQSRFQLVRKHLVPLANRWHRRRSRPRILVYTDSRGNNLPGQFHYLHYPYHLARHYEVDLQLVPHKRTMLPDFLAYLEGKSYDAIVLHTGIVDYAPRPYSGVVEKIYPAKREKFDRIFGRTAMEHHLTSPLPETYLGAPTINMYSMEMFERDLLPRLRQIPRLVYVSSCPVVPGWRGNYFRERPRNLNLYEQFDAIAVPAFERTVDLTQWTHEEVKEKTFDIIHPNELGSLEIYERVRRHLRAITGV